MRLAGAPISNAGRVEVLYAGVWGTIRGWNWDISGAHVVCRQLGYPGAILFGSSNQFGIGNGPSWFENVRCLGNESSFEECSKDILGYPNGGYSSVATVLCKSKPQPGETSIEVNNIFLCLMTLIEHFQKAVAAGKGRLIGRQSENLVEFLQNPFPLPHSLTWIIL